MSTTITRATTINNNKNSIKTLVIILIYWECLIAWVLLERQGTWHVQDAYRRRQLVDCYIVIIMIILRCQDGICMRKMLNNDSGLCGGLIRLKGQVILQDALQVLYRRITIHMQQRFWWHFSVHPKWRLAFSGRLLEQSSPNVPWRLRLRCRWQRRSSSAPSFCAINSSKT